MKRIANYRSGDRSEALGIVLMQLFCAVAPVPRPEDFGIVDAVGTLLRRDGRFLYAEDSLLLQFKSRTTTCVEYLGDRFRALLDQELALFIARVDLTTAEIKLYCTGPALAHPNIHDMSGLVAYFEPIKQRVADGVLHTSLGVPALQWSAKDLADQTFEVKAYRIMKHGLELERWNRRYRKMGMQTSVMWTTNEMPTSGVTTILWNPQRSTKALEEVVPGLHLIASVAKTESALLEPVLSIMSWLRSHEVEADPGGMFRLLAMMDAGSKKMAEALQQCADAEAAVHFVPTVVRPAEVTFWMHSAGREGHPYSAQMDSGSIEELAERGISVCFDPDDPERVSMNLNEVWLALRKCEIVGVIGDVTLLRKRADADPTVIIA